VVPSDLFKHHKEILTDVLELSAREVADMLETTEQAIYGAIERARAKLARHLPKSEPPPLPNSPGEKNVLDRLVRAWEECDTNASASQGAC
jgi:hypothetical protein